MGINQPNVIPPTTQAGWQFVSVGDGTGRGYWIAPNSASNVDATKIQGVAISATAPSAGSVLAAMSATAAKWESSPTVTGQVLVWDNGSNAWKASESSPAPVGDDVLIWDNVAHNWFPGALTITMTGDVTGNSSSNEISYFQGIPVNPSAITVNPGDCLVYNGSAYLPTLVSGGVTNAAWSGLGGSVSVGTTATNLCSVTVAGFTVYAITFSFGQSGNSSAAQTVTAVIDDVTGGLTPYVNAVGQLSSTAGARTNFAGSYVYIASTTASRNIELQAYVGSSATQMNFSNLMIVGIQ